MTLVGREIGVVSVESGVTAQTGAGLVAKRVIDVVLSLIILAVTAPLCGLAAVAIRLESRGPALFKQDRVGRGGTVFTMFKFRSMRQDADPAVHREHIRELMAAAAEDDGGPPRSFKVVDDARLTRVGRFIRAFSIDELPQLVNVIRGEMSLIGPRPEIPYALENYLSHHHRRFAVLPGLSGLWQVSGRDEISPRDMLELDVQYAEHWSMRTDLSLMARTVPVVFGISSRRGS